MLKMGNGNVFWLGIMIHFSCLPSCYKSGNLSHGVNSLRSQGLTLRFQIGARKGLLIKNSQKTGFLVIKDTILAPSLRKSRGPHQNLGAYALGNVEPRGGFTE